MAKAGRPLGSVSTRHSSNKSDENVKQCESCLIVAGGAVCSEILIDYREHRICCWCKAEWEKREKQFKREINFDELFKGKMETI